MGPHGRRHTMTAVQLGGSGDARGADERSSWISGDQELPTNTLWDQNHALDQLAIEGDGTGAQIRRYHHGRDLVSFTDPTGTYYPNYTNVGSVSELTDSAGALHWDYRYDPFGTVIAETDVSGSAPENPMRFTGEYLDPTGLYHLRARQYDPEIGSFLSIDPVTPEIGDPYVASYIYANQRPTVFVDPSGELGVPSFVPTPPNPRELLVAGRATAGAAASAASRLSVDDFDNALRKIDEYNPARTLVQSFEGCTGLNLRSGEAAKNQPGCGTLALEAAQFIPVARVASGGLKIVASNGTEVTGFTRHGINRVVGDGLKRAGVTPAALLDALKRPRSVTAGVDPRGRPFQLFVGQDARVTVNPATGRVVSVNPLTGRGAQ